jgi:hypothetical protein
MDRPNWAESSDNKSATLLAAQAVRKSRLLLCNLQSHFILSATCRSLLQPTSQE